MTVLITVGDYLLNVNLKEYIHLVMEKMNVCLISTTMINKTCVLKKIS